MICREGRDGDAPQERPTVSPVRLGGLSELVGQNDAVAHLTRLATQGRMPHAMLFEGPSAVGKFTAARLLAKALLCQGERPSPVDPCGKCASCLKVDSANHGDLNIITTEERQLKIESVRTAERALRLRPVEGGVKVLLVEDAQRMNVQAQNALLKTLEEPPGNAHIILTTARLRNILPTVVSRCQRISFKSLPLPVVVEALMNDRGLAEPQARLLASLASGSLGRAMALEDDEVFALRDQIAQIDRELEPRSATGALLAMTAAAALAEDKGRFADAILLLQVWLQDQMRLAADPDFEVANIDRYDELQSLAEHRGLPGVIQRLRAVNETRRQLEMPYNFNAQLLAEQLCLDLAGHGRVEVIDREY